MQKRTKSAIACLGMLVALYMAWVLLPASTTNCGPLREELPVQAERTEMEEAGFAFLRERLQDANDVLAYSVSEKENAAFCVSESMGQAMEYAALCGDASYFARMAASADRHFLAPEGYYYWKLDLPGYQPAKVSALIDDLRIFKAYALAQARGLGAYETVLRRMSERLYAFGVSGDTPCDYYDGNEGKKANVVSIFYLDTRIFSMLRALEPAKWEKPYRRTCEILREMPKNRNGFYPPTYRLSDDEYLWGDTVNMVENLYTGLHLYAAGGDVKPLLRFLRKQIKQEGKIYNWYHLNGTESDPNESTAVYALATRLFAINGDEKTAQWCYGKVMDFQIEAGQRYAGGFGDADSGMVYAFDQLEALLMMRMVKYADA